MRELVKILLIGASGRMGREIAAAAARPDSPFPAGIVGGIVSGASSSLGQRLPNIDLPLASGWDDAFQSAEVIVDFSSDAGAVQAIGIAASRRLPLLLASTGLSSETKERAEALSHELPVILTANTSIVVTAMLKLAREAAKMLAGFDVELVEMHHRNKKDAPSGTALQLLDAVAGAQQLALTDVLETGRSGREALRTPGSYGAQAVRGGDCAGEHTLYFLGEGERLEITQRATTRRVFAEGALRAAHWLRLSERAPGLFSMEDVLTAA